MPGLVPGIFSWMCEGVSRAAIVNEILIRAVPSRRPLTITVKK
jgi:hypothetical protein